jgi:class 3 adenylate cyclase/predicted ATPase
LEGEGDAVDFDAILEQVLELVQRQGRASYRAIKRRFDLDDDYLKDLREEILFAYPQIVDEDGRGLVWTEAAASTAVPTSQLPLQEVTSLQNISLDVESHTPDAERRQLTVLFCDLADSTRLAQQLDPEDLREVLRTYQATCVEVIQRFSGHVAQYLGDGLLVYFSYPQAHEDDAQRAVRTGLGILAAMETLNTGLVRDKGVRLAVRVGIHTGLVVVGEMGSGGRHEHLALGDTPNLAARLQGLAESNTVVISDATSRLVQGYFTCQDLGTHTLKGLDTPVHVYQVLGESAAQSRLDVAGVTGLTPLVGREPEVALLRERWAQSTGGVGQVVVLSGEGGIGKSRLVHELTEWVVDTHTPRLTLRCSPYHTNSALYPVIEHLQRVLHWHRDAPPEAKLATLEQAIQTARLPLAEVVPLVAALLSLPVPAHYPPLTLSPQRQKQKTQEALVAWLLAEAAQQPVLAIWEDLHWADPSTLELLRLFLDQSPTTRVLLVLTCRPEFQPPWASRSYVTPHTLTRLLRPQVEELILRVTGGKPLPAEVVQQIVAKTDGIPLFVEELVKTILESGLVREEDSRYVLTGLLPPLAIPATLQDALMARLDRLASVKEVAQLCATLGREFAYEVLRAVAPLNEPTLQHGLEQLVDAELLYQRGIPPQATYIFKHALIQDAAYQSLLKSTRQQYHQRIAQILEERFPEAVVMQPELLAHHYTEAGLQAQAIPYLQQAGQRAIQRSANLEAISHLTKGLEVLTTLPDTLERAQHELDLQIALGVPLIATQGLAAPAVERVYARARALCQHLGDTPQLFPGLWGTMVFYTVRGELQIAQDLALRLHSLAQRAHDTALLLEAHHALWATAFWRGELLSARTYADQGRALYVRQQHQALAFLYGGHDPGVCCRDFGALALWLLGYPDQACSQSQEAQALAGELSHPFSRAEALGYAAWLAIFRREAKVVQAQTEALQALAQEHAFLYWLSQGAILEGWACVVQGQERGIAQMSEGLATYRATGSEVARPYYLALLAEAYGYVEEPEEGLGMLTEALEAVHTMGGHYYEAELYRLQGTLVLHARHPHSALEGGLSHAAEAEACFHQALTVARQQQAKALELRAAMSLARLWQQQGKRDAARELLAPIYGWFTEGFDTADLQEAKALLEELSQ